VREPSAGRDPHPARDNIAVLEQGLSVIEGLTAAAYVEAPLPLARHGAGSHFRHCLDYYACFLAGVESGRVDYDGRERSSEVERDPTEAARRTRTVLTGLARLTAADADRPLLVKMDGPEDGDGAELWSHTTVRRELRFLSSHTIHHYALIAWTLRHQGIEPGATFGVAPSTLRHRAAGGSSAVG
jgi:hypothetical protein